MGSSVDYEGFDVDGAYKPNEVGVFQAVYVRSGGNDCLTVEWDQIGKLLWLKASDGGNQTTTECNVTLTKTIALAEWLIQQVGDKIPTLHKLKEHILIETATNQRQKNENTHLDVTLQAVRVRVGEQKQEIERLTAELEEVRSRIYHHPAEPTPLADAEAW